MSDEPATPVKWFLMSAVLVRADCSIGSLASINPGGAEKEARSDFIEAVLAKYGPAGTSLREVSSTEIVGLKISAVPAAISEDQARSAQ